MLVPLDERDDVLVAQRRPRRERGLRLVDVAPLCRARDERQPGARLGLMRRCMDDEEPLRGLCRSPPVERCVRGIAARKTHLFRRRQQLRREIGWPRPSDTEVPVRDEEDDDDVRGPAYPGPTERLKGRPGHHLAPHQALLSMTITWA